MAYPNQWENFTCTITDVEDECSNIVGLSSVEVLNKTIANATITVKAELYELIRAKFKAAGKTLPDDLPGDGQSPDDALDTLFSDSFETIRRLIVYYTIYSTYAAKSDIEMADHWLGRFKSVNRTVITIWIDVDEDSVLDSDEDTNSQDLLDNYKI